MKVVYIFAIVAICLLVVGTFLLLPEYNQVKPWIADEMGMSIAENRTVSGYNTHVTEVMDGARMMDDRGDKFVYFKNLSRKLPQSYCGMKQFCGEASEPIFAWGHHPESLA